MGEKPINISILSDNNAAPGLRAEHGFSLWIETEGVHLLFDTGSSDLFIENAKNMKVDLKMIDALILSHGHYDHTGGIKSLFEVAAPPKIYLHPSALKTRYSFHEEACHPVSMPEESLKIVSHLTAGQLGWVSSNLKLSSHVGINGVIPRVTDFEDTGGRFYLDQNMSQIDIIEDDMTLWFETNEGLVICTGCCHSGLINTLQYITQLSGTKKIKSIVGGLHLLDANQRRLSRTVAELGCYDIQTLVPCHCTGDGAVSYLKEHLHCKVIPGYAGLILSL